MVASLSINMAQALLRAKDFLLNPYFLLFQKTINGAKYVVNLLYQEVYTQLSVYYVRLAKMNAVQYISLAINSTFMKVIMFSFKEVLIQLHSHF